MKYIVNVKFIRIVGKDEFAKIGNIWMVSNLVIIIIIIINEVRYFVLFPLWKMVELGLSITIADPINLFFKNLSSTF